MRLCKKCGSPLADGARYWTCKACKNDASRAWGAANRERVRWTTNAWYAANRDRKQASVNEWIAQNREMKREQVRRRRAKLRGAEGSHTVEDLEYLRIFQRDRCNLCNAPLCGAGELDHIIPAARGGSEYRSNLQWLCMPCNRWKSDKLIPAIPRLRNPLKVRLETGWSAKVCGGRLYADNDGCLVLQRPMADGLHRASFPWEPFDI